MANREHLSSTEVAKCTWSLRSYSTKKLDCTHPGKCSHGEGPHYLCLKLWNPMSIIHCSKDHVWLDWLYIWPKVLSWIKSITTFIPGVELTYFIQKILMCRYNFRFLEYIGVKDNRCLFLESLHSLFHNISLWLVCPYNRTFIFTVCVNKGLFDCEQ